VSVVFAAIVSVLKRTTQMSTPPGCVTTSVQFCAFVVSMVAGAAIVTGSPGQSSSHAAGTYLGMMCFSHSLVLQGLQPPASQPYGQSTRS
jgi:hypothetical protein